MAADARHDELPQLQQLIEQYLEKERAGIIIDPGRYELYLVPPCPLAADLFAAARQSGADAEDIPDGQLLVISIHAKVRAAAAQTNPTHAIPCFSLIGEQETSGGMMAVQELDAGARPPERSQSSERQHRTQHASRKDQGAHVGHGHAARLHAVSKRLRLCSIQCILLKADMLEENLGPDDVCCLPKRKEPCC